MKEESEAVENEEEVVMGLEGDLLAVVEERAVRWGEVGILVARVREGGNGVMGLCFFFPGSGWLALNKGSDLRVWL